MGVTIISLIMAIFSIFYLRWLITYMFKNLVRLEWTSNKIIEQIKFDEKVKQSRQRGDIKLTKTYQEQS